MSSRLLVVAGLLACSCSQEHDAGWRVHPCPDGDDEAGPPLLAPVVDGLFDDWSDEDLLTEDAVGDASGAFDVTSVAATARGSQLFVKLAIAREVNLYSGDPADGTLVLELTLPDGRRLSIDFRKRSARLESGVLVPWRALGLVAAPAHAANAFELRLDLEAFGAAPGERLELDVSGSDALAAPAEVAFFYAAAEPPILPDARADGTELRVASLNTHEAGLLAADRAQPTLRLLRAAAADIYLLQELGDVAASEVAARLDAADPHGAGWQVHAVGGGSIVGNAVASRAPLVPVPLAAERVAAAVVLVDPPVLTVSVHLKCCGYQGSDEDRTRLDQVADIAAGLMLFRSAALGAELAQYRDAPLIVGGDFNDVGSPDLTAVMTDARALALERWRLPHLARADVFTWSGYEQAFPPAALDMLLYRGLEPLHGFVLDSSALPRERLQALGLWAGDSQASDHLLLVADFRR